MNIDYSTKRIIEILGNDCVAVGDFKGKIGGIASLSEALPGDLSFLSNPRYRAQAANSKASVLLLPTDYSDSPKSGQLYIKLKNPSFALAIICRDIELVLSHKPTTGVHPSAVIETGAEISPNASIGPFCYISSGARIGSAILESHVSIGRSALVSNGSYLYSNVSVGDCCEIGLRNRLMAGCVIGSDGYGYEFVEQAHQRVPQIGNVVTKADVDIGSNSCVDRARFGSTQIGAGTKIDNQVQIAHNVKIGDNCLITAQVGISGSTVLGDGVVVGGQAGIAGHLTIGSGAMIAAGSAVFTNIKPNTKIRGYPALSMMQFNRITLLQRKLPHFFKRFDQLEKTMETFTGKNK